jgi:hypothetical protein
MALTSTFRRSYPQAHAPARQRPHVISDADIKVGDVLLCWPERPDFAQRRIQAATGSRYVHAAIVMSETPVYAAEVGFGLDTLRKKSLRRTAIRDLVSRYGHVVVLRHPEAWPHSSAIRLRSFIARQLGRTRYRALKALRVEQRGLARQANQRTLLDDYFTGRAKPRAAKSAYFCSEFVVECFMEGGYLHESAAVVYCAEDTSPGRLALDNTFGFVVGYLTNTGTYVIPASDPYRNQTRYGILFPSFDARRGLRRAKLAHLRHPR